MIQDTLTQIWVKFTGFRIDPLKNHWLTGPAGDRDIIGDQYLDALQREGNLTRTVNEPGSGLIDSIHSLGLTDSELQRLRPEIIDFYERTVDYQFEIRSEWKGIFKPFGTLLSLLFGRRLQQLNIPTSSLAVAKGFQSDIIKLKKGEKSIWTIWYRKAKSTGDVIFSGIYTTTFVSGFGKNLVKVIFPLPNGNASVILTHKVLDDGSFLLSSDGKRFGENGFYFYLTDHKGKHWAKFVGSLHEWVHVYVDGDDILRTDHRFQFFGISFLNLHYKMTRKGS